MTPANRRPCKRPGRRDLLRLGAGVVATARGPANLGAPLLAHTVTGDVTEKDGMTMLAANATDVKVIK
jgi:hypothetical protein